MACATLKRSLELDPLQTPHLAKRPRFIPSSAPSLGSRTSIFAPCSSSTPPSHHTFSSPVSSGTNSNNVIGKQHASRNDVQTHCRQEMRRLNRRRQLHYGLLPPSKTASIFSSPPAPSFQPLIDFNPSKFDNKDKEKPLFTFQQVKLICERMVREREEQLRETYESALNAKLAEQYDTFVKFTHDHVQRHFETNSAPPSYLS